MKWLRPLALLTVGGLAGLGLHLNVLNPRGPQEEVSPLPTPPAVRRMAPDTESVHALPTNSRYEQFALRRKGVSLGIPTGINCIQCHTAGDLPERMAETIAARDEKVRALFHPEDVHSDIHHGLFSFAPMRLFSHEVGKANSELASTGPAGIQFKLPFFTDARLREESVGHELTHFHTMIPGDYLNEFWASPASLLSGDPKKFSSEVFSGRSTKFVGVLQRAAFLNDKAPPVLEPNWVSGSQSSESFRSLRSYVTPRDLDAFKPVFRDAFHEYRRNNLFWDAAILDSGNPWLPIDVMIARQLNRHRDPDFIREMAVGQNPGMSKFLRQHSILQRRFVRAVMREQGIPLTHAKFVDAFDLYGQDPRSAISYDRRDLSRRAVDYMYYGSLFRTYCRPDGQLNYSAVSRTQLRRHARAKLDLISEYARHLREVRRLNGDLFNRAVPVYAPVADHFVRSLSRANERRSQLQTAMRNNRFTLP